MTTLQWARFMIARGDIMAIYRKRPDNPYWAHDMTCQWHREDGLVVWDLPPFR
jgi:hypothetical protein